MRTDVNACDCTRGFTDTGRVSTESWLWKKNPLPHRVIEPVPAACRSDALPTELHPHPNYASEDTASEMTACNVHVSELFFSRVTALYDDMPVKTVLGVTTMYNDMPVKTVIRDDCNVQWHVSDNSIRDDCNDSTSKFTPCPHKDNNNNNFGSYIVQWHVR